MEIYIFLFVENDFCIINYHLDNRYLSPCTIFDPVFDVNISFCHSSYLESSADFLGKQYVTSLDTRLPCLFLRGQHIVISKLS